MNMMPSHREYFAFGHFIELMACLAVHEAPGYDLSRVVDCKLRSAAAFGVECTKQESRNLLGA